MTWDGPSLYETLFTINLFGSMVIVALAAIKLARNDVAHRAVDPTSWPAEQPEPV